MGFFDFLKKTANKKEVQDLTKEKVSLQDLSLWVKNKRASLDLQEKKELSIIVDETLALNKELKDKIAVLEAVDIDAKKDESRAIIIVKGNVKSYISFVRLLIKKCVEASHSSLEEYAHFLDKQFHDFFKKSDLNYQKGTYLVGKEISSIKESLVSFYNHQKKVLEKHENIISSQHLISSLQEKLSTLDENTSNVKKMNSKIALLTKSIAETKKLEKECAHRVEQIKSSKNYLENLQRKKDIKTRSLSLQEKYASIKQAIDFKVLTNELHTNPKEMQAIQKYKTNFITAVQKDDGKELTLLLKKAKLLTNDIEHLFADAKQFREDLRKMKQLVQDDATSTVHDEMKKLRQHRINLQSEKEQDSAIKDKIISAQKELIASIKKEFLKLNVIVET